MNTTTNSNNNTDLQTGVRSHVNRIPAPRAAARRTAEHQISWEGTA
jgi:hypothetical protein